MPRKTRGLALTVTLISLACLIAISLLPAPSSASVSTAVGPTVATNDRLGIAHITAINQQQITSSPTRYQLAQDTLAGWNRWVFYWHEIETSNGVSDYTPQDTLAASDTANGLRVDAVLLGTPSWCTSGLAAQETRQMAPFLRVGQKSFTDDQLAALDYTQDVAPAAATSPPVNLSAPIFNNGTDSPAGATGINQNNYWARFVYNTVSRFKTKVGTWEIWNEPDFDPRTHGGAGFWAGSPEDYARLLKVAYMAAKYADPTSTVIMGGMMFWSDQGFVPPVLQAIKADPSAAANNYYFDATAWHWYGRSWDLRDMVNYTRNNILAPQGFAAKPYWVNESGTPVWNDPAYRPRPAPYPTSSTLTQQASYVLQSIAYALSSNVSRMFTFQLYDDGHDENFGLLRNDNSPRPGYYAYKLASTYFRDISSISQTSQGNVDVVSMYATNNQRVVAFWNKGPNAASVTIQAQASSAWLQPQPTETNLNPAPTVVYPVNGVYTFAAPGAVCDSGWAPGECTIGGLTYLLIENGVVGPQPQSPAVPVSNGGFETSPDLVGWTLGGSTPAKATTSQPLAGLRSALLGADLIADPTLSPGGNSTLYQYIDVPSVPVPVTADFVYDIDTTQPALSSCDTAHDIFEFIVFDEVNGQQTPHYLLQACNATSPTSASIDLSPWKGKHVRLAFNVWQSSAIDPTTVKIDQVQVRGNWPYHVILPSVRR